MVTTFECKECGGVVETSGVVPQRCPNCGSWGSLRLDKQEKEKTKEGSLIRNQHVHK